MENYGKEGWSMMLPVALSIADEIACSKTTMRVLAVVFCVLNTVQIFLSAFVCHVFGLMLLFWTIESVIAIFAGFMLYRMFRDKYKTKGN